MSSRNKRGDVSEDARQCQTTGRGQLLGFPFRVKLLFVLPQLAVKDPEHDTEQAETQQGAKVVQKFVLRHTISAREVVGVYPRHLPFCSARKLGGALL
jgi:hypothetical protein